MKIKYVLLTGLLLTTYGCAGTAKPEKPVIDKPEMPVEKGQCFASQPKAVSMWVNKMPGPGASGGGTLNTSFTVTTPTPGYLFALKVNKVMESSPEQVVLDLIVTRPKGIVAQVITQSEVSLRVANFPGSPGSVVQVNCGGKPFFKVDKLMAVQ